MFAGFHFQITTCDTSVLSLSVCAGLKKYSNWPTYPQLYVKGELLGGLDILKVWN